MRALSCVLVCALAAAWVWAQPGPGRPDPAPEVRWARGIADDYWRAVRAGKRQEAAALLSPELSASLARSMWYAEKLVPEPAADHLPGPAGPADWSVAVESEELAPDRSEVLFRGRLCGKDARGGAVAADFTMRVARQGPGARWDIRFLLVTDRAESSGKRP